MKIQYNRNKNREKLKQSYKLYIALNIKKENVCSSQRSQAFELATTTERLQVGGGYTVLIQTSYEALA